MNRIKQAFEKANQENRAALIGFVVAGDPNLEESLRIIDAACDAGLDLLELGIPFSAPVADGPVIQRACARAIGAGMNINQALDMVATLRKKHQLPIILFSYCDPILAMGNEAFIQKALNVGADGLLVVDIPHEEPVELTRFIPNAEDFSIIRLLSPTAGAEQQQSIAESATGFLYVVSRPGVTGAGDGNRIDWDSLKEKMNILRTLTSVPLAVGFGITDSQDVAAVSRFADGVIIGSAFERAIETAIESNNAPISESVARLVKQFRPFLQK